MWEITKVYREQLPAVRLIGRKYGKKDADDSGAFAGIWEQWFQEGLFAPLDALPLAGPEPGAYLGFMQLTPELEYWIGVFCQEGTVPPDGYEALDIEPSDLGVCWIQGPEEEVYGREQACIDALRDAGMNPIIRCMERYQCPRFTTPDDQGRVILDLCFFLES